MERGATVALYTDGATDARNPAGDQFGMERLERAFTEVARQPPEVIVNHVATTVGRFEAGAPVEDDLTLLVIRYRGQPDDQRSMLR
jgi:sigma-B regulation protein RsbU (phosphoserine phosphatase)